MTMRVPGRRQDPESRYDITKPSAITAGWFEFAREWLASNNFSLNDDATLLLRRYIDEGVGRTVSRDNLGKKEAMIQAEASLEQILRESIEGYSVKSYEQTVTDIMLESAYRRRYCRIPPFC